MKRIAILMHAATEGPGSLGTFLEGAGAETELIRLHDGAPVPADPHAFRALVSMGGPMNVYEEERFPFLAAECELLRAALRDGVPALGVCLGAQMIAKAAGARVMRSPRKEVGWGEIRLTAAATRDPLLGALPETLEVLQWHEDMFEIPEGGVLLARSPACPHQAFRIGAAWGLQFHVEATREMLAEWFAAAPDREEILRREAELRATLERQAERIFTGFLRQL
jgi:GMP synthase-like glutamine amidotransferase